MKALQLGWVIALWMTLGVLGGLYVDKRFQLTPFGIIAGSLLAIAACAYQVYRVIVVMDREDQRQAKVKAGENKP
jgi:F0F1-type ATP synthase assembly protein I